MNAWILTWGEAVKFVIAASILSALMTWAKMRWAIVRSRGLGYQDGFAAGRNVTRNELKQNVERLAHLETSVSPVCEICGGGGTIQTRRAPHFLVADVSACPRCNPDSEFYRAVPAGEEIGIGAMEENPEGLQIFRSDREVVR